MPTQKASSDRTWELIENEKRRDRFVRWTFIAAWAFTLVVVLGIAALVSVQAVEMARAARAGAVPWMVGAMPLFDMMWKLALLVMALSTVGIFLRIRTASLAEIQLRLAAIEEMLASRGMPGSGDVR